jgi:hypothetical protein
MLNDLFVAAFRGYLLETLPWNLSIIEKFPIEFVRGVPKLIH